MAAWIIIGYLVVGGLITAFGAFFMGPRTWKMADREIDRIWSLAWYHRKFRTGLLPRLRWLVGYRILPIPPFIVAWPMGALMVARAIRAKNHRQRMRALELAPVNMYFAAGVFAFALLLLGVRVVGGPGWAIDLGCTFLLVGLTANLIASTISVLDLPAQLRRNLMQPYAQFVVIAALQYFSLLIGSLLLGPLHLAGRPTFDVVVDQLEGLGAFTNVFDAVLTTPRTPIGILLTVTGVCLFALIGKVVIQYRKFVRLPADHAAIVTSLSIQGKFEEARRWLDHTEPQVRQDSSFLVPRLMVLVGEDRYDKAAALAEAAAVLHSGNDNDNELPRVPTRDDVLGTLLTAANLMDLTIGQYRQLIRFLVDRGITDGYLAVQALELCELLELERIEELTELGISYETHPVVHAQIEWILTDDRAEEARALDRLAAATPVSDTDRMARAVAMYWINDVSHDDVLAPTVELLDLIEATDGWPAWCCRVFARAMDIIASSQDRGTGIPARARRCESKLLAGIRASELEEFESRRQAERLTWEHR